MKNLLRTLVVGCLVMFAPTLHAQNGALSLDHVTGLTGGDTINTSVPLVFHLRLNNNTGDVIKSISNGYRIYSTNGITWTGVTGASTGSVTSGMFDLSSGLGIDTSQLGKAHFLDALPDTIGFWGARFLVGTGLAAGFDQVIATISLDVSESVTGGMVCIDTAKFGGATGSSWLWNGTATPTFSPDWGGPYCYTVAANPMSVYDDDPTSLPDGVGLMQNYPNPFNPSTTISFDLTERSAYTVTIYNTIGQLVQVFEGESSIGRVNIQWDASRYSSGIYFYRLEVDSGQYVKKMVLIK